MERYYRIEFTALLEKMTLAFKMECDIEIFGKEVNSVLFRLKSSLNWKSTLQKLYCTVQ